MTIEAAYRLMHVIAISKCVSSGVKMICAADGSATWVKQDYTQQCSQHTTSNSGACYTRCRKVGSSELTAQSPGLNASDALQ